jgi:hypothetical protein
VGGGRIEHDQGGEVRGEEVRDHGFGAAHRRAKEHIEHPDEDDEQRSVDLGADQAPTMIPIVR